MSTATGRQAEDAAADFLRTKGHKILAQNWRTRWCEIDIVVQKGNVIYFVEVKYRRNSYHGDGLEYITPSKLRQMHFSAEVWMASHKTDQDYGMLAVSVTGQPPVVQEVIEI